MTLKVIYTECSCQPWFDVAALLQARNCWKPIYWTAADAYRNEVVGRFPDVIFHDNYDAARGIPARACARLPLPALDESFLREFAYVESLALRMMDRMEPDESFTFWQRIRLYHNHLRYWLAVLDHLQPDVVVFPSSPHLVYDYVVYALCQRRGVKTALVKETGVNGLLFVQDQLDGNHPEISARYHDLLAGKSAAEPSLSERSQQYLAKIRGDYEHAKPVYLEPFLTDSNRTHYLSLDAKPFGQKPDPQRAENSSDADQAEFPKFSARNRLKTTAWTYIRRTITCAREAYKLAPQIGGYCLEWIKGLRVICFVVRDLFKRSRNDYADVLESYADVCYIYDNIDRARHFIRDPATPTYLVRFGEKPEDKTCMSGIEFRLYRRLATRKKDYLAEYYRKLCLPVDFAKPYVFVALNYQCECSTSPDGGEFVELTLMVRLLSELIPAGWHLYVKEHPAQFHSSCSGESARTQQFYDDLAALPNVSLVPLSTTPFQLIDNSRAVATVNGTSGWEAIIRGKPTLLFGHAWYKGCEGIFFTPTREACRQALQEIVAGYQPDFRKIKLFVRALELCGTTGGTLPEYVDAFALTHDENVQAFASVLAGAAPVRKAA